MISEVLKEVSILFETRVEPGEVGLGEIGVGLGRGGPGSSGSSALELKSLSFGRDLS
jgi:hypothetical protein